MMRAVHFPLGGAWKPHLLLSSTQLEEITVASVSSTVPSSRGMGLGDLLQATSICTVFGYMHTRVIKITMIV